MDWPSLTVSSHRDWTSSVVQRGFPSSGVTSLDSASPIDDMQVYYFMLSGRISRNSSENIFRSYTSTISENTDFHVLVVYSRLIACSSQPDGNMTSLT